MYEHGNKHLLENKIMFSFPNVKISASNQAVKYQMVMMAVMVLAVVCAY